MPIVKDVAFVYAKINCMIRAGNVNRHLISTRLEISEGMYFYRPCVICRFQIKSVLGAKIRSVRRYHDFSIVTS